MQEVVRDENYFGVKFWGVRGSVPCPGAATLRYGGNTSCIEVNCGEYNMIFDAGTGLKSLGDMLSTRDSVNYDIFMSHTHIDHISGFPFFKPAYSPKARLKLWAGHLKPRGRSLKKVMETMMDQPLFPVTVDLMAATMIWTDFKAGETIELSPEVTLRTAPLHHPEGATGYRIDFRGRSLCYITDTEHMIGALDNNILELIEGADLVIYDSTYTDDEFPSKIGWGHSTWQEGARLCDIGNVKTFVAFHHDPDHDDKFMDQVNAQLQERRPNGGGIVAMEGMTLTI
jgi:phosphoribosyl 1,2-cyclic phosphodiesterase